MFFVFPSKYQGLKEETKEDSISEDISEQQIKTSERNEEDTISEDISEQVKESKSQESNEQGEDNGISPTEQAADNRSQDLKEQDEDEMEDKIKALLETSDQKSQEAEESSPAHITNSLERSTADWKDELSSFLATEPDTSTYYDSLSLDNKIENLLHGTDWMDSQVEMPTELHFGYEEELPCSIKTKSKPGWKDKVVASCPITECKLSFHDCCCYSAAEQMIKHSPLYPPKAPRHKNFAQKYEAKKFQRSEINSVSEKLPKQRYHLGITRKKECAGFTKIQLQRTSSSGSHKGSVRRSKVLYNLYTTFCDEGEQFDPCLVPGAKGLSRACTIFSAIKKGRINANHLLLTLHTLGILMAGTEMHEALRCVPVDARGNLDFVDFLDIVNCILPYTETEALRNAQKIFRRIKRDMVYVEDLETILASLGVSLDSKIIELALGCIQITWDGRLNISEFLRAVRGSLSHHKELDEYTSLAMRPYQDFTHFGDSESSWRGKWSTLNREMPPGHTDLFTFHNPHKEVDLAQLQKEATKSQKSDGLRKPRTSSLMPQTEEKDKLCKVFEWPKIQPRLRYSSQDTLFPLSSTLCIKEETPSRHPKTTSLSPSVGQKAVPAPSSIAQSVNYKTFQQKMRKKLSFQENLPRRYGFGDYNRQVSKSNKPGGERKVHSGGQSALQAFQDAFDTIRMLAGESIRDHELCSALKKLGVSLNDKEFQELLQTANVAKDGRVNLNSFIFTLEKTQFSGSTMLKGTIQAIDKIEGDKMVVHDLPSFMRSMGVHLTDQEFQQALKQIPVDGSGKVFVRDFIKILTNTPHFSELSVLKDTIKAASNIQGNKVPLQDLKSTLKHMGIHLYPQEYEELIQNTPNDGEGNIDIDQVIGKISKTQRFSEIQVLNNAIKTFSQFKDEKVAVSDMQTCLKNIGVHLTESELEEATTSLKGSSDGTVNVKELISAVKGIRRFQNYSVVLEVILALKFLKKYTKMDSTWVRRSLNTFGFKLANEVISQVLKSAHMTEAGWAKFNNFLRILTRNQQFKTSAVLADGFDVLAKLNNGRIGVDELQAVMKSFNIYLPSSDLSEALAYCNIDENKTVNLNDFLRSVTHTGAFITNPGLQLTCMALSKLKDGHFDLHALESTLNTMDLPNAKELLQDIMKMAQVDNGGNVNFEEFMRIFIVVPEFPEAVVLKDIFDAMSNIKDHQIHVDELPQTLANVGLNLTPDELQSLSKSVTIAGDGTVGFEDVIMNMTGAQSFAEFTTLRNTFSVINKAFTEKIKKEDLPGVLEGLGFQLPPDELQAVLASASTGDSGKLDGIEIVTILSNVPCFSESKALRDATKVVESITDEKVTVNELKKTLSSMGVHLPNTTFNELVKSTKTDEDGRIGFKDFLLALGETDAFTELEALQHVITITGTMHGSQQQMHEVQNTLGNLGIHLTNEEFQQIVDAIDIDSGGMINLKEFLLALSKTQRFMDSMALHSAIEAFGRIKSEKVDTRELETIVSNLGINLSNPEFQKALKNTSVDEGGRANFKEFLVNVMDNERFYELSAIHDVYTLVSRVKNDKVEVSHLEDVLAAIGITLNKEEMKDVMKNIMVDEDGKVTLKEFVNVLLQTQQFSTAVEMEGALKAMQSIKQDKVNIEDLDSIMYTMGLNLSPNEIQQALKYVVQNVDGTVSLRDFMFGVTKTQRFSKAESK
nr:uncharacterized protein LOC110081351 isoform X3 [Pogona vitticeps]